MVKKDPNSPTAKLQYSKSCKTNFHENHLILRYHVGSFSPLCSFVGNIQTTKQMSNTITLHGQPITLADELIPKFGDTRFTAQRKQVQDEFTKLRKHLFDFEWKFYEALFLTNEMTYAEAYKLFTQKWHKEFLPTVQSMRFHFWKVNPEYFKLTYAPVE